MGNLVLSRASTTKPTGNINDIHQAQSKLARPEMSTVVACVKLYSVIMDTFIGSTD